MTRRRPRFSRTDWNGDSIVVIVCGAALLASLFLPWANERRFPTQNFTYAFTKPAAIRSILFTDWGPPVLVAGIAVVVVGSLMLALGPRLRIAQPLALALAITALVVLYDAGAAMHALYSWGYAAGTGVLLAVIVGLVLPVTALAAALTARILCTGEEAKHGTDFYIPSRFAGEAPVAATTPATRDAAPEGPVSGSQSPDLS